LIFFSFFSSVSELFPKRTKSFFRRSAARNHRFHLCEIICTATSGRLVVPVGKRVIVITRRQSGCVVASSRMQWSLRRGLKIGFPAGKISIIFRHGENARAEIFVGCSDQVNELTAAANGRVG
jgi:hypothetical protein